jgi:fumarate reductase flavoprotein subunit
MSDTPTVEAAALGGPPTFDVVFDVVVVGAGACGLSAGLAAADSGAEVLVVERDPTPLGSTAMSTGLIPAAGTPEQAALGLADSPEVFLQDMLKKTKGRIDVAVARRLAEESTETVAWLRDRHWAPLSLVQGFLYSGHSFMRMYGTPNRTGSELQAALQAALEQTGAALLTGARVDRLFTEDDLIVGVEIVRPDGAREQVGCRTLILACCGFAGNADMVRRWLPEMADAVYHGHPGNKGDAMIWGEQLGAELADMTGYQGHGGLAAGFGVTLHWPVILEGGFQVNREGRRFSDESLGYSEQAAKVNAQTGGVAWSLYDERLHQLMHQFEDYHDALKAGAVMSATSWEALAALAGLPVDEVSQTANQVAAFTRGEAQDPFGRDFTGKPVLAPPFYAVRVTGALFHTQGGLAVDPEARVKKPSGGVFPNLFAGGGAARGVSGPDATGYLAGNGLLTATTLGKVAGRTAARQCLQGRPAGA